jgi:formylglycine-generating enzyme required for sulfatase activity
MWVAWGRLPPAAALLCGCSGVPFTTLDVPDGAASSVQTLTLADAALTATDADVTAADGGMTQVDGGATLSAACGSLRGGTAREVCFAGASFTMGSDQPNLGVGLADHTPAHPVTLHSYTLDAYEVSVARYGACVQAGACTPMSSSPGCASGAALNASGDSPVMCVTWGQASSFCAWDGGRRLPTEAEWEFAARGAADRTYPWGDTFSCALAIVGGYPGGPCSNNSSPGSVEGNGAGASPELVYNLAGNVAEWVADWVGSYPSAAQADPSGPLSGTTKVVRGGAFSSPLPAAIAYARMAIDPTVAGPWGFRCARDPM